MALSHRHLGTLSLLSPPSPPLPRNPPNPHGPTTSALCRGDARCGPIAAFAGPGNMAPERWPARRVPTGEASTKLPRRSQALGGDCETQLASEDGPSGSAERKSEKLVLVVGATGGVGQLVLAALIDRGIKVRALLRNVEKACALFGEDAKDKLEMCAGDARYPEQLDPSVFQGVTHVICCSGTTAFPSKRWEGGNTPEATDWHGLRNLVASVPSTVQRFVLVSSVGVTKYDQLPWSIMNLFGVLKYKKMGEDFLQKSGLPYTIIRPGRLTDGPYTSYDLNTLLKATVGTRRAVLIGQGDKLVGEASRHVVAEACIQALDLECTCGQTYEVNSVEGDGPGNNTEIWENLFTSAHLASGSN